MADAHSIQVLIVEDEMLVSELVRSLLEDAGYQVAGAAGTGRQALELAERLRPDVLILDINLPDMDGLDVARQLAAVRPTPVVVLTAYETPDLVAQAGAAGAGAFLTKPPDPGELDRAIRITLARFADLQSVRHLNAALRAEIAQREQAEAALRETEARFRNVLEHSVDAIFQRDLKTNRYDYFSPAITRISAFTPDEMLAMTEAMVLGRVHPDDQAAMAQYLAVTAADVGQTQSLEYRFRHKAGYYIWVQSFLVTLPDAEGQPALRVGTLRDVTRRKLMEEALRQSEARFRSVLEHSLDAAYQRDLHTNMLDYFSPAIFNMTGYAAEALMAKPFDAWLALVHPDDAPALDESLRRSLANLGQPQSVEYRVRHKAGHYRWFQDLYTTLGDAEGKPVLRVGNLRDITERKEMEEALRASEEKYRAVFSAEADALFLVDPVMGVILDTNTSACETYGYTRDEMLNRKLAEFSTDPALTDRSIDYAAGRPFAHAPLRYHRKKDGTVFPVEATATPVEVGGRKLIVGTARDITQRLRAEEEILRLNADLERRVAERTEELRQANAALTSALHVKDEFLAAMSHELRTPLTAMMGLAEALQMNIYGPLTPKQLKSVQTMHSSGQHLLDLITDVLDFAQAEAGPAPAGVDLVVVAELCQACVNAVWPAAQHKNLQLVVEYQLEAEVLHADSRRLRRMLVHLLDNAVKFTPEGGEAGLIVSQARAGDDPAGPPEMRFTVWDKGIGIAPADQPRLFQPFVQLDSRLARQYEGAGLGLALVSRMAQQCGGRVKVESTGVPGEGSRFTLCLPLS